MAKVVVGKWGKNLALRMPAEIVRATGLKHGEQVEIETRSGEIVIQRQNTQARTEARRAAQRVKKMSRGHSLAGLSLRELIGRDEH